MDFIPVPDSVMCELRMTLEGQVVENTLWFQSSGDFDITDMLALGTALNEWWVTNIAPGVSSDLVLTGTNVTDMRSNTAPGVFVLQTPNAPGEGDSDRPPNNVALCVSFRTNFRGRSARGRNFIAGLQNDQITDSQIDAGVADFFTDAYSLLMGAGTFVTGWQWVVASRFTGGEPRTTGLTRPITAVVVVDPIIDSQRRRLPGRGT